jgi:hypothetical protein
MKRYGKSILTLTSIYVFLLVGVVSGQQIFCAPNSLPRNCGGYNVCTILGNCGYLQEIGCCVSSGGFPTNTPTGVPPPVPTPSNLPTFSPPTPTPTAQPSYYLGEITTWYTQNLSATGERIERVVAGHDGQSVYIVGRQNIGDPEGWTQSSLGFVRKINISDLSVAWTKTMGAYLGYNAGGIYDTKVDGSGVYVSGYTQWGKNIYVARLSLTTGETTWEYEATADSYWNIDKGLGIDIDSDHVFVISSSHDGVGPGTPSDLGNDARWQVYKLNKLSGDVENTRSSQLSGDDDVPRSILLYGAHIFVGGEKSGKWYMEKLNKEDLSLVLSAEFADGSIDKNSIISDSTNIYIAGITNHGEQSRFSIRKLLTTDLGSVWSYSGELGPATQKNARIAVKSPNIILVGNHTETIDSSPQDVRVTYIQSSNGSVVRDGVYTGVGYVGSLWYGILSEIYLSGSTTGGELGAIYELDQIENTPTPTPTKYIFAGCSPVTWVDPNNVTVNSNTFVGNTYEEWNFENGADSDIVADGDIGGYAEIPLANPNYGAMWGLSPYSGASDWVEYGWYVPYYSGSEVYITLPGRQFIPMGTANIGDRFLVQRSGQSIVFAVLAKGETEWATAYSIEGDISEVGNLIFRGRVAGYSQVYKAYVGTSCQPAVLPTSAPYPTLAPNTSIEPWYTANLSSYPEFGYASYPDATGEHVYLVGRKDIGRPFGWHQSSRGFVRKIKVSDKSLVWSQDIYASVLGYDGGLYDVKEDGDNVYITGYTGWGTDLYVSKLNKTNGAKIWTKKDNLGWSWLPWKGLDFELDSEYIYIASNTTKNDFDADMYLTKKRKSDGVTVATRRFNASEDDWDGYTNVVASGNYLYLGGYRQYDNARWYLEKLNKSDLSLVTSVTGVEGVIDMHGMNIDGQYVYIGGFEKIAGDTMWSSNLKTQIRVEKRRLSDLGLIWSYNTNQTDRLQGSTALTIYNGEVLATANDSIDRVGWFGSSWMGDSLRFVRINKDTGQLLFTGLYDGVGNVGSIEKSSGGDIYLAGATAGTSQTAIFKINDILVDPQAEPFGISVTQSVDGVVNRGSPITINIDIENDGAATQAAWAFEFADMVPSSIIGVTWDCQVVNYGFAKGDMFEYQTRCGVIHAGSGNNIQFSHSSSADPLIHPGGKIRITIDGTVAPNAPNTITNTAKVNSYVGWPEDHFYTLNFISSPTNYQTIADNDTTDNESVMDIDVGDEIVTPTSGAQGSPTTAPTFVPTPTIPPNILSMCFDDDQILRFVVKGKTEYYCEDNDQSGHNLIMIRDGVVEKLNSQDITVENVVFEWGDVSTNGYRLVTVTFTGKTRVFFRGSPSQEREYSSVMRVKVD